MKGSWDTFLEQGDIFIWNNQVVNDSIIREVTPEYDSNAVQYFQPKIFSRSHTRPKTCKKKDNFCFKSYDYKFLPLKRNSFLWQEKSSCDKKFLAVIRYFFLWQDIASSDKKIFPAWTVFFFYGRKYQHVKTYLCSIICFATRNFF